MGASGVPLDQDTTDKPATAPVLVAPATGSEFNTIREQLVAAAAWQLDDIRFEFDSSLILPDAAEEFAFLAVLRAEHPKTPLSLFGHADPTGDDDYNKRLSGRRVIAVFALLTRRVDLWEQLFSKPIGNDKWGDRAITLMRSVVAGDGDPPPLPASPGERAQLFRAYMDELCRDLKGTTYQLDATADFLAGGKDAGGKGDFQGCSEFNPELMFSAGEKAAFDRSGDKDARDRDNAPNRRVVGLLFRPGTRVDPARWPCPRATEGTEACHRRFFADARVRRSFQAQRRTHDVEGDTFACRFYERIADSAPGPRLTRRNIFQYGVPLGRGAPFSQTATVRIVSEDGKQARTFKEADGFLAGPHRVFVFTRVRTGIRYRGEVIDGGLTFELFSFTDLSRVLNPADALNLLQQAQPAGLVSLPPPPPANFQPFTGPNDRVDFTAVDDATVTRFPITTAIIK